VTPDSAGTDTAAGADTAAGTDTAGGTDTDAGPTTSSRRWALVSGPAYLVLSVLLWWQVWTSHPTTTTTCGCGDAARFLWFFEWPAYAFSHAHGLFYSSLLFHPTGINLLNDTSVLALGVVLTPVTLAVGPVAAMNVALTLAPALSAWAMFWLLRRWVAWAPAAFVGGLLYGFAPFVVTELALNQLNIAFLAVPPLVVLALDDLLVRQRRSPTGVGAALGALVVVQFFVSTEVLVILGLFVVVGVVVVLAATRISAPELLAARAGHAVRGSLTALGVAVVVLAYPLWFLLRGPAHLTGPIWSNGSLAQYGNTLTSFWRAGNLGPAGATMTRFGGYQGPSLPGLGYLGVGVVVVAVAGLLVWRHDRRLQLFAVVGVVAAALSLGPGHGAWVPWQVLSHLPWIGDIVEIRLTVVLILCAAVMVGVVLDHAHAWALDRPAGRPRLIGGVVVGGVVALALVPSLVVLAPNLPLTARAVVVPRWYAQVGAHLPPGRVLLTYPAPFSGLQSSQAYQAVTHLPWAQAGGGGPAGEADRAGRAEPGFDVLVDASLPLGPAPGADAATLAAVRRALALWKVTTIVVPDQPGLPVYAEGRSPAYAAAFFTAVVGRAPRYEASAWVWSGVTRPGHVLAVLPAAFAVCAAGPPARSTSALAVPDCIIASAR
jgi:hypothetical protein